MTKNFYLDSAFYFDSFKREEIKIAIKAKLIKEFEEKIKSLDKLKTKDDAIKWLQDDLNTGQCIDMLYDEILYKKINEILEGDKI